MPQPTSRIGEASRSSTSRRDCADLQIILVALAIERGDDGAGLSGQIVERNFSSRPLAALPFSFRYGTVERGEFVPN
jgi:hypothetical protein